MQLTVRLLIFSAMVLIFAASQLFWFRLLWKGCTGAVSSPRWRIAMGAAAVTLYLLLFIYNLLWMRERRSPVQMTLQAALLEAPFGWWVVSSLLGFAIVMLFRGLGGLIHAIHFAYQKATATLASDQPVLASPSRRRFLERAALAAGTAPFVADAYGLLYARLNLETTRRRIHLGRLPQSFHGFRILQLSDIHIGPFMSAEEIRKYVTIANEIEPDLVALTGDFITWDPKTQEAVVKALSGLHAPFGVFGCLGNHEMWTDAEDSITGLFSQIGIRVLRQASARIELHGEMINLVGVDFQTRARLGTPGEGFVTTYLRGVERLVRSDAVNILLSHNPNTFDRAAELGIDLSLAGHTHGGQLALEFVHRNISPSRLITPYVKGWFQKGGAQLYVNRGIGTIAVPIRLNARPEITVFELVGT